MKWSVILLLSLLGVGVGFLTILSVNTKIEQVIWLMVFVLSAYFIYKYTSKGYFLTGIITGAINCCWVTIIHIAYQQKFIANHTDIQKLLASLPPGYSVTLALILVDLTKSILYVLTSGVFAVVFARGIKNKTD